MEGLLSFLLFAAFFFVMMRWGCGAHMVHGRGGHGDHGSHEAPGSGSADPVCGMEVKPGEGYAKAHAGKELRFCSRDCLDKFEAAPERYLDKEEGAS